MFLGICLLVLVEFVGVEDLGEGLDLLGEERMFFVDFEDVFVVAVGEFGIGA